MKVCILGNSLVSLSLAKALVNKGINTEILSQQNYLKYNKTRTLGISKSNIDFFNKNIVNIDKLLWDINKIEIFSENLKDKRLLKFENSNQRLFSLIKNDELKILLLSALKRNKLFKIKKLVSDKYLFKGKYELIINCDSRNIITKKFFYKKMNKNYNSFAHTTIIHHKKLKENHTATQTFTKKGPIAFLPLSEHLTSVVYSMRGKKNSEVLNLIKKYNPRYEDLKIKKIENFELKSSYLRNYYYKNILAFGDLLHRLHPLAGQGFNMNLRDIKILSQIIKYKLDHGLELDSSICVDFENKTKHKNYLFTSGIDSIYEFFNLESKMKNKFLSKSVKFFGQNKLLNKTFEKIANSGFVI